MRPASKHRKLPKGYQRRPEAVEHAQHLWFGGRKRRKPEAKDSQAMKPSRKARF